MKIRMKNWTDPKISPSKPSKAKMHKIWYVHFRYYSFEENKWKQKKVKSDLNSIPKFKDRLKAGRELVRILERELERNWNPDSKLYDREPEPVKNNLYFLEALDFAMDRKREVLRKKTIQGYESVLRYVKKASKRAPISKLLISEVTRRDIKVLLENISRVFKNKNKKTISGHAYNKFVTTLKLLFSELEEYEYVEYNPCTKIKPRKEIKTNIHRHATEKEKNIIKNYFMNENKDFLFYLNVLYQCGMRVSEIRTLQIKNIDWTNQNFVLDPIDAKDSEYRYVPIPNNLFPKIRSLKLLPEHYYVLGAKFIPSDKKLGRDVATRYWKKHVKEKLGIDVSLYSFKGLGGDARRDAGISLQAVSTGFGHSSLGMTMRYTHKEQERINKQLKEKTPEL